MLRYALADCSSPSLFFTIQTYSPKSLIIVGSMLKLPSGPKNARRTKSCRSGIATPSLYHITFMSACLVTQWKKAVFPSNIVWLIGGILIKEPPSTATWNHVPFLIILGVRFGKSTLHSYQPVSETEENICELKIVFVLHRLCNFTHHFLWSTTNSRMLVLDHNDFRVNLFVQCMFRMLLMFHRTKKTLFVPEIN